jgi:hypothetical protein
MAIATAVVLLVGAACGEETGPVDEAQDFSGNYTLAAFSQGVVGNMTDFPAATGTFTMTATTYAVSIDIPGDYPVSLVDHGTYSAIGTRASGNFSQQSTDNAAMQYAGTYTWNESTSRLTIDTTSQGIRTVLVLQQI